MMDINPNNIFGSFSFSNVILWILGLAGVIQIVDSVGFLPGSWARWLARNRLKSTVEAMRLLGVRVDWDEEQGQGLASRVVTVLQCQEPAYKTELRALLSEVTFENQVLVGETRSFSTNSFIDVMGGSTGTGKALHFAKILKTHWMREGKPAFDVVATPKTGSPLIGYEFAKIVSRPLVLGVCHKGTSKGIGHHLLLDCPQNLELSGKRILLLDDSTTGGSKMISLAEELRRQGALVEHAFVLFEPQGKGAREGLKAINIELHSIVDGPTGRY